MHVFGKPTLSKEHQEYIECVWCLLKECVTPNGEVEFCNLENHPPSLLKEDCVSSSGEILYCNLVDPHHPLS